MKLFLSFFLPVECEKLELLVEVVAEAVGGDDEEALEWFAVLSFLVFQFARAQARGLEPAKK